MMRMLFFTRIFLLLPFYRWASCLLGSCNEWDLKQEIDKLVELHKVDPLLHGCHNPAYPAYSSSSLLTLFVSFSLALIVFQQQPSTGFLRLLVLTLISIETVLPNLVATLLGTRSQNKLYA